MARIRRVTCLVLSVAGLAAWQLGCGSSDTSFSEGVRVDELDVRDIGVTVTETGATITWISRRSTASEVHYGIGATNLVATGAAGTEHTVTIDGLAADTLYLFRVTGFDRRYRFRTLGGTRTRLAFVSDRLDSRREVYLALEWCENVTRVTEAGGHSPALSADGSRLAWIATGEGGLDDIFLCQLDADGVVPDTTENVTATADRAESHPAFSPDGAQLGFGATTAEALSQIILRALADGTETVLVDNGASNGEPAWSPEGTEIAFVSSTRTATIQLGQRPIIADSIVVTHDDAARTPVDESEWRVISESDGRLDFSHGGLADQDVLISYTGGGQAVVGERHGIGRPRLELYTIDTDGGDLRRLTTDGDARSAPVYNPADGRILHAREGSTGTAIRSVLAAGGSERSLVGGDYRNRDPATAPDGLSFIFSSNREDEGLVNLYRADFSGNIDELSLFSSGDTQPAWAPIP